MKAYNTTLGGLFTIRQNMMEHDIVNQPFTRKGGLAMARNMKKIDAELEEYCNSRDELIRKYSDGGSSMDRTNPHWDEFVTEFNEISSVETSININTITENDLPENISPAACLAIDFMIEEQTAEE